MEWNFPFASIIYFNFSLLLLKQQMQIDKNRPG